VARPAAAPAVEAGPFNMGEARARLGAAAAAAAGCKKSGGPSFSHRVAGRNQPPSRGHRSKERRRAPASPRAFEP
jgi:hypothetical protein